jgi:hypothetical protein
MPTARKPVLGPVNAKLLEGVATVDGVDVPPPLPVDGGAVVVVDPVALVVVVVPPATVDEVDVGVEEDVVVEVGGVVEVVLEDVVDVVDVEDVVVDVDVVVDEVGDVEAARAMTGARESVGSGDVVMPEGVTESLGNAVQVSVSGWPEISRVRVVVGSCSTVMASPVAVNGPSVPGVDGTCSDTPLAGTGLGRVTLKFSVPVVRVGGVAPVTSSCPVAEPVRGCPGFIASAAPARAAGRTTVTW